MVKYSPLSHTCEAYIVSGQAMFGFVEFFSCGAPSCTLQSFKPWPYCRCGPCAVVQDFYWGARRLCAGIIGRGVKSQCTSAARGSTEIGALS